MSNSLTYGLTNRGGHLGKDTPKEFSISLRGFLILFYINFDAKFYTLIGITNTRGRITDGTITIDYVYNSATGNMTLRSDKTCELMGIYQLMTISKI